jgi:hypothetical protein
LLDKNNASKKPRFLRLFYFTSLEEAGYSNKRLVWTTELFGREAKAVISIPEQIDKIPFFVVFLLCK